MDPERRCQKCGHKVPWGQIDCPFCPGHGGFLWTLRRDTFLLITLGILLALFVVTGIAVRFYHSVEKGYAQDWYTRGENDLRAGRAPAALIDFRTALSYSHDNEQYQLRLAQALTMPGSSTGSGLEARTYLVNLLERQPGNAQINLELARLAARDRAVPDALRYYHGAIYGEWSAEDPAVQRRAARFELVSFLLQSGQKDSARSELIELATDLPPDPTLQVRAGTLLTQVNGCADALKLFRQALRESPNLSEALAGAGECYFESGEFAPAERYLARVPEHSPRAAQSAAMLETSRLILSNDPFNSRLSGKEKSRRAAADLDTAIERLEACGAQKGIDVKAPGNDPLQILFARASGIQPTMLKPAAGNESEIVPEAMDTVFEIEQSTARVCGDPTGLDQALLLMAHEPGGNRP